MPLIDLPKIWVILIDSAAWAIIQPLIGWLAFKFPDSWIDDDLPWFQVKDWEDGGQLYQRWFRVRAWKHRVPSGGKLYAGGFSMTEITSWDRGTIARWVKESCRAELCHWVAILPSALFFLWNPWHMALMMVLYACVFNAIPIIIQRYNRPRLLRVLKKLDDESSKLR